ncbi:beta-propeller fold lactonase family protein [Buchnera aphidicola]|uniref:6-phosphogluconolactonase n=1 Tax=Buchnera aphidicola (Sarucallis kahawaluokalani) TaxID=1241878 RepID=A0A4D6YLY6_9GAMM|nr:beta-propeller fold lactonase family protein [Buchnera aphidicola]QCI25995.1 6-phosphogluconolactonase [Buchnera aphidicola (Sarucallis kahawaluokalani)]
MKQIIYIVSAGTQSIEVWKLLYTGQMELIQNIYTECNEGQPITISKKKNKLYIGIRPKFKILIYDILCNGKLKKKGEVIIPHSPNYLLTDHKENFLFCSYYHANCFSVSNIDNQGIPSEPIQYFNNILGCHAAKIDISNQLILVTSLLKNRIYLFELNKKNIYPLNLLKYFNCLEKSGPRHIIYHNNKNYAYSINELNGTIDVWKINIIQKSIINIQNISLIHSECNNKKFWSADIHITSCNNYLYASDRLHHTITIFKILSNYKLDLINQINTVKQPKSFTIDYNSQYLIVAGQASNTVIVYNISKKNGLLNQLYEYSVGNNPTWIITHQIL